MIVKKIWIAGMAILSIFYSCSEVIKEESSVTKEVENSAIIFSETQMEIAGIEIGYPEKRLVADVVDCSGFLSVPPTNTGTIHSPIDGIVKQINVVTGKRVKKNEALVLLSDPGIAKIQEEFLNQKSNLEYQQSEFERKTKLYRQEAISKKDYLAAQNSFKTSKYRVESLREQLSLIGISETELSKNGISSSIFLRAPFEGYISDVFVNIGMYVDENKSIIEIINYDHVHLELSVYSNDINKIELGQTVQFRLAGSDKTGWGTIRLIGKKVDEINRSVLVHAFIDKIDYDVTIGSSVLAEILTKADSAFTVPEDAIIKEGDLSFVFIEDSNGFIKTKVATGRKYDEFVELLNVGDLRNKKLVTKGAYYLTE